MTDAAPGQIVVDAANVVGSRPDGWWRDRPGAARRLVERIAAAVETGALDGPVLVVLEGAARRGVAPGPARAGLDVDHAPASGDDAIVDVVVCAIDRGEVTRAVTADRALRARVERAGATTVGPRWLLDRLPDA